MSDNPTLKQDDRITLPGGQIAIRQEGDWPRFEGGKEQFDHEKHSTYVLAVRLPTDDPRFAASKKVLASLQILRGQIALWAIDHPSKEVALHIQESAESKCALARAIVAKNARASAWLASEIWPMVKTLREKYPLEDTP